MSTMESNGAKQPMSNPHMKEFFKELESGDSLVDVSKRVFGGSEYETLATAIGRLTDEKARQYGDSAERSEKIMKVLYPNGVPVSALKNALLIVRMCDKLCRIATQDTTGVDGAGEDAYKDIAGYALIGAMRNTKRGDK